jgi:hypothetical protein
MSKTFYHFVWSDARLDQLISELEKDKSYTDVVIFGPEEHELGMFFLDAEFIMFKRFLNYHNVNLKMILGAPTNSILNYRYRFKDVKELSPWHTFFANFIIFYNANYKTSPCGHNSVINKHFTSMNGRSHPWRCMFIDYMYKYNLFDKGYISWHNSDNWEYMYDFKWWTPKKLNFDKNWDNPSDGFYDIYRPPLEFKDSLFSVISESNLETIFVTEKTYIPIYHKRPFIIFGAPYTHQYLKSLGFMLFDEIIDYSFDSVDDDEKRCDMFMKEVAKLCNANIEKLRKKSITKVEHNFNNLLKIVENKKIVPKEVRYTIQSGTHERFDHYKNVLNISNTKDFLNLINKDT